MNNETSNAPSHPLVAIAGYCASASAGIGFFAFVLLHQISDGGMWAIAAMAAAPALMGIGMAYFITKQPQPDSTSPNPQFSPGASNT
jgi:hypothetical protein